MCRINANGTSRRSCAWFFLLYDLPQQGSSVVRRHEEWKEHLSNAFSFEYGKDDARRTLIISLQATKKK